MQLATLPGTTITSIEYQTSTLTLPEQTREHLFSCGTVILEQNLMELQTL